MVGYNIILGTPFLLRFHLSVLIASHSLYCNETQLSIFDHQCSNWSEHVRDPPAKVAKPLDPLTVREQCVLEEFKDLFPIDILAVSAETDAPEPFNEYTFPKKLQDPALKVQHKIILTDPEAMINKRQYAYPQKNLVAWQTLLDQHMLKLGFLGQER
jgi:hypothetical protein